MTPWNVAWTNFSPERFFPERFMLEIRQDSNDCRFLIRSRTCSSESISIGRGCSIPSSFISPDRSGIPKLMAARASSF